MYVSSIVKSLKNFRRVHFPPIAVRTQSFAMGSPEGYGKATEAVALAAKKGTWVLLKNVHLSPLWLANLEKKLHRMQPHRKFRLFMTMEINPKVGVDNLVC